MARRQAPHGRSRALPEGSDTPGVATGRTAETTIRPLPPSRSRALASCAQHSAVRPSGHRSIAPCDVYILPFTTQVNHRSAPPVPNLTLKPEVTFCVQTLVAGQAEQEVDAVCLAPRHQGFAGKAGITAQQDAHPGPALADLFDNPRHLLN